MDRLNQWLALAASLGVLVGIVFLIVEIQQNTTLMKATAFQDRSNNLIELSSMAVESPELLSALTKLNFPKGLCHPDRTQLDSLTPLESTALKYYIAANLFRIQNLEQQYARGLISPDLFEPILAALSQYGEYARALDIPQEAVSNYILNRHPKPKIPSYWCD